jgi:hypothetical protein
MSTTINFVVKPVSSIFLDFLLGLKGLGGVEVLQGVLSNILPLPAVSASKIKLSKMQNDHTDYYKQPKIFIF